MLGGIGESRKRRAGTMKRREFISVTGIAALAGGTSARARGAESVPDERKRRRAPVSMHLGTQQRPITPEMLQYFKRHGVNHICGSAPDTGGRGYWIAEELERERDLCERHGITLSMVSLPFLKSSHIDREKRGAIMLADSPERDRDIEDIQKMTAACAKAGVPAFKYNMSLLGVLRTDRNTPGRGGSSYSSWRLKDADGKSLTRAGKVTDDMFWERISYFLERVIPVCNEYKIRAACHPHDPGVPPEGFQGVNRVLGTPEGLKKFVSIQESPYHGLNFCVGSVAEMLQNPAMEIYDVIRYFGKRKKIFNIHFRNIRGNRDDFSEVYPDEGDLDMLRVALTLHEAGYKYMVMPDHMPKHPDDPRGLQAFAYVYGYIKAILQAVEAFE